MAVDMFIKIDGIKGESKDRVQGTPEYMAPETHKHKMVNERTDIYNLGATMYRLLTWRHPPSTISEEDDDKFHAAFRLPAYCCLFIIHPRR